MIISTSKITSKRRITLSVKIMARLKLHPGDDIVFEEHNGRIEVKGAPQKFTIHDLIKKNKGLTKIKRTDEEIRQAREEAWLERYKRYLENESSS